MPIRYQYRAPEHGDYVVGFIKIIAYGIVAVVSYFMIENGHQALIVLWGSLLAHCLMMVYDAFIVVTGKASLSKPSFLNYLIAIQNPEPTFLGLLDIVVLIVFLVNVFQLIF